MRKDYERLFSNLTRLDPPPGLMSAILARIDQKERQTAQVRVVAFSVVSLISIAALVPAINYFAGDFNQSGFSQYFSLLFTDGGTAMIYWKDFALSLLESLPIISTATLLATTLILLSSLKLIAQNAKIAFLPVHLT